MYHDFDFASGNELMINRNGLHSVLKVVALNNKPDMLRMLLLLLMLWLLFHLSTLLYQNFSFMVEHSMAESVRTRCVH